MNKALSGRLKTAFPFLKTDILPKSVNINKNLEDKVLKKTYKVPVLRLLLTDEKYDVLTNSYEAYSERFSDVSEWFNSEGQNNEM